MQRWAGCQAWFIVIFLTVVAVSLTGCGRRAIREPYPILDQLPESVEIIREFHDRSGMDAFFLWKATYQSESDIQRICEEFRLEPSLKDHRDDWSFAELIDQRYEIAWFPLRSNSKVYEFCSLHDDGSWKEGVDGRYVVMLWVNETNKELIIQLACM